MTLRSRTVNFNCFDSQCSCQTQTKQIFCALHTPQVYPGVSIYVKTHMCLCYHENKSFADSAAEHALSKLGKSHWMDL